MSKKPLKLLYLSCHSVLEYDEIKLFKEIGIDVFSHGVYRDPNSPGDNKRPGIKWDVDQNLLDLSNKCEKENLTREMIEPFDAVMVMHVPDWVINNWEIMKDKIVIWRSIGQNTIDYERILEQARREGLKIIRYSPRERTIPGFIGEDAMIRFYKDPDDFGPYTGEKNQVFNISQSFKQRASLLNYEVWDEATKGLSRKVAGSENEPLGDEWIGCVDYKTLKDGQVIVPEAYEAVDKIEIKNQANYDQLTAFCKTELGLTQAQFAKLLPAMVQRDQAVLNEFQKSVTNFNDQRYLLLNTSILICDYQGRGLVGWDPPCLFL